MLERGMPKGVRAGEQMTIRGCKGARRLSEYAILVFIRVVSASVSPSQNCRRGHGATCRRVNYTGDW